MRIGVAGLNGSGKSEVVRFLEQRSFHAVSLSDVIRADLARDGLEPTRDHMIERGRLLRERHGLGVLAERATRDLPPDRHHVIDSIRHPAEVEALRAAGGFTLLWIDASIDERFARSRRRGRAGDGASLEEFQALEARELDSPASGQQLVRVQALADIVIVNNGDLAALHAELQQLLQQLLPFRERPSWDEYFMSIARVVASRSNCVKRMVGSVIVSDRRIISTGYNGTPRGVRNCNEGGCPRCAGGAPAGTRLDECLCSHAEENAITQAAYHGARLRGAVLYTTFCPCLICTKMIINAGIDEVVYGSDFPLGEVSIGLFREAGLKVRRI
jgi:dCMP deaminase